MKLEILNKCGTLTNFTVCVVWQDIHYGMDVLYYETPADEKGKGTFLPLSSISTWRVTNG